MSGTVDERLARIVHNATFKVYGQDGGTHTTGQAACQEMTRQLSKGLADSGVVLVERSENDRLRRLRAAAEKAAAEFDASLLPHDVAYEDVAEALFTLAAALRSEDPA